MEYGFQGGVRERQTNSAIAAADWVSPSGNLEFFLSVSPQARLFEWDGLTLLVSGYVHSSRFNARSHVEAIAEEVRAHYLENGDLAVEGVEGSFTLALLDTAVRRIHLYRNLIGGATYYHDGPQGFLFGSNLPRLVEQSLQVARPNGDVLPEFFVYRTVPGRQTLFDGFFRLLPGEEVTWDAKGVRRKQWHTWGGLRRTCLPARDCLEAFETTTEQVLRDAATHQPAMANLLSGGLNSSWLQASWNRFYDGSDPLPASWSVSLDHPRCWADTDYAVTAAHALGSRHTIAPCDGPFIDHLVETIALTGEPPGRPMTAYMGHLARSMAARGHTAALCGIGGDSLFGLDQALPLHFADRAASLVPGRWPRRALAALAEILGNKQIGAALRLAANPRERENRSHPISQLDVFTDWDAVHACFGASGVMQALEARFETLDRLEVGMNPLERLHSASLFGDVTETMSSWSGIFQSAGLELFAPYLDARMLRLAIQAPLGVRYPSVSSGRLVRKALAGEAPAALLNRPRVSLAPPILEWLAPGGQLRPRVDAIARHEFLDDDVLAKVKERPGWFLYSLLCYDLWHKLFIERSLLRKTARSEALPVNRRTLHANTITLTS